MVCEGEMQAKPKPVWAGDRPRAVRGVCATPERHCRYPEGWHGHVGKGMESGRSIRRPCDCLADNDVTAVRDLLWD